MLLMVGEREVFSLFIPEIEQRTPTILEALLNTCGISDSVNNFSIESNSGREKTQKTFHGAHNIYNYRMPKINLFLKFV